MNDSVPDLGVAGRSDERAVSDVVAFTLMFSIIILSVALVSILAVGSLVDFSDAQHVQNNDRGTQAVASTLDNIHRSGDSYRQVDISPGDGNLFFNQTSITIESDDVNLTALAGPDEDEAAVPIGALETRFERSDRTIYVAYEGGGVFRTDYAEPRYRPSLTCGDDTTIVSVVNLTTDDSIYETGVFNSEFVIQPTNVPGSVPFAATNEYATFEAERVGQETARGSGEVELDVSETAHPEQWERFFESAEGWTDDGECDTDAVLIRVVTIELSHYDE